MIKIGITGGIGSGKSVVSSLLELAGIPVYPADEASKHVTETSPVIRGKLIALIDESIYINGKLDRQRLASIIFNDEDMLHKVNEIIHPVVKNDFADWCAKQTAEYFGIESAILYESRFDKEVNVVLMVFAPVALRLHRAMLRDDVSEAEILNRITHQMPDELKRKKADYVIINDDVKPIIPQTEKFVKMLKTCNSK